jgi:hypothetical protein
MLYWCAQPINFNSYSRLSVTQANFEDVGDNFGIVLLANFSILAVSMLLISSWMALYGTRIYMRLRVMTPVPGADHQTAFSALRRVNLVLCVLVACALLRIFTLAVLMYDIWSNSHDQDDLGNLTWFTFSNWIPTLGPGYILLFITRRVGGGIDGSVDPSILQESKAHTNTSLLTSECTSSTGPLMNSDSIYSSGRTLRVSWN